MGNLTKCSYFSLQWFPKTALSGPSLYPDVLRLSVLRALSDREKCSHKLRPHPRRHFYHELTFISEAFLKAVLNKITDNLLQRHHVVTGTITVLPILHIRHTWLPEVLMCQNNSTFWIKTSGGKNTEPPPGKTLCSWDSACPTTSKGYFASTWTPSDFYEEPTAWIRSNSKPLNHFLFKGASGSYTRSKGKRSVKLRLLLNNSLLNKEASN